VLAEIQAGLATPVAGIRWLTEVVWDDPYTGPIPVLSDTGMVPVVSISEDVQLDGSTRPVGSIWDALDETAGIPILSRAALWRRDAVERRTVTADEQGAISA
jgi:hypothetical protein